MFSAEFTLSGIILILQKNLVLSQIQRAAVGVQIFSTHITIIYYIIAYFFLSEFRLIGAVPVWHSSRGNYIYKSRSSVLKGHEFLLLSKLWIWWFQSVFFIFIWQQSTEICVGSKYCDGLFTEMCLFPFDYSFHFSCITININHFCWSFR